MTRFLYEQAKKNEENLVGNHIRLLKDKISFGEAETYFNEFLTYFYTWEDCTEDMIHYQLTSVFTAIVHNALLDTSPTKYKDILPDKSILLRCLLYTSPSPRDRTRSRMPSSA